MSAMRRRRRRTGSHLLEAEWLELISGRRPATAFMPTCEKICRRSSTLALLAASTIQGRGPERLGSRSKRWGLTTVADEILWHQAARAPVGRARVEGGLAWSSVLRRLPAADRPEADAGLRAVSMRYAGRAGDLTRSPAYGGRVAQSLQSGSSASSRRSPPTSPSGLLARLLDEDKSAVGCRRPGQWLIRPGDEVTR
jgi:hypothetical protein